MRVLIVEDEAIVAMSLTWELQSNGHAVVGATGSAVDALALARLHHPDLALVDISLHGAESGLDLAEALRSFQVPVVFVTAQAAVARAHSNLALGLIRKPCHPETVAEAMRVVSELLAGRSGDSDDSGAIEVFYG